MITARFEVQRQEACGMTGMITLYHPIHAPHEQPVCTEFGPLTACADDPAKFGVNP